MLIECPHARAVKHRGRSARRLSGGHDRFGSDWEGPNGYQDVCSRDETGLARRGSSWRMLTRSRHLPCGRPAASLRWGRDDLSERIDDDVELLSVLDAFGGHDLRAGFDVRDVGITGALQPSL